MEDGQAKAGEGGRKENLQTWFLNTSMKGVTQG
jgi:hypothetical protein